MSSIASTESSSSGLSPAAVDRQVLGRSIEWMRRVGHKGGSGWGPMNSNLQNWNPWTNETLPTPRRQQRQQTTPSEVSDAFTMTTKSAGSVYDHIMSQELRQIQQQRPSEDSTSCDLCSSSGAGTSSVRVPRPNSNTNNKNPFSQTARSGAGLRDVQRHKADGKQTTIITQFKAVESSQDGKVDINILMDSESNISNAQDESSEDATAESDREVGESSGTSDDSGATGGNGRREGGGRDGGSDGPDGIDGPGGSSVTLTTDNDPNQTPGTTTTGTSPGEAEVPAGEGDEEGEGEGADDSDAAEDLPAPGDDKKADKTDKKKLSMGHLDKEGVVIGCMNVFADVSRKEYIVLLTDKVVEAFLIDPGQFRSIAKRTGCEIEVTRRILNRRIGMFRWVKYLVVTLRGPNLVAIDQCDRLMVKAFPPYKIRKPYPEAAQVALFVKESYPDNSDLYFNFQRTGPTTARVGDLRLNPPFGKNEFRPIETTPWKQTNQRLLAGILEPRNLPVAHSVQHVYPEWGTERCTFMDESCKWEQAGDLALDAEKKNNLERSLRVKQRKLGAEPLFAGTD